MNKLIRMLAVFLLFCLLPVSGLSANMKPTPTPPPENIGDELKEPPEIIRDVLDIAYGEWESLAGKRLKKVNKYTEWRGKGIGFGWCGGYVTWCMIQAGVEMETLAKTEEAAVTGVRHVKEASVGKLLRGYQRMGRTSAMPQKGFLVVYAVRKSANKTIHVGLVYDVQDLGGGRYRVTTLEGNMSNRVKMYIHDYDMNAEDRTQNLSKVPEEERTGEESSFYTYKLQDEKWYINCFLMPWDPRESADEPDVNGTDARYTCTPTETPVP